MPLTREGMMFGQIALCVADFRSSVDFYCDVLGFARAGWTDAFEGALVAEGLGLPTDSANIDLAWVVDQQEFFNIEIIQFLEPPMRSREGESQVSDIGYSMVLAAVNDFAALLDRLEKAGVTPIRPVQGSDGDRRVAVRDPDGVIVEVREKDVRVAGAADRLRPEIEATIRGIRLSVPDLTRSKHFFGEVLGLAECADIHEPEDEETWGLGGARRDLATFCAGDGFIEIAEYVDPQPKPWPTDSALNDQGVLNIAFGSRERGPYERTRERVAQADGTAIQTEMPISEVAAVNYVNDPDGFSVELIYMESSVDKDFGLIPVNA